MVTLLAWVLLATTPANCRALYQDLRYREAITSCREALPHAAPGELPELYRLLGLSFAAVNDHPAARQAFVSLLTIDPAAALSGEYAPRIRADFEAARATGAGASVKLSATATSPLQPGVPLELAVQVDDGPATPVSEIHVRSGTEEAVVTRAPAMHVSLAAVAQTGPRALELVATDALGGRIGLWSTSLDVVEAPGRGPLRSWALWGALAVAFGGASTVFGVLSRSDGGAAANATFADDRLRLQQQANTFAITADVGFGLAAALVVTTVVMLVTR
jgi:hypothetical protein